ncbi:unnamed protein product, partial [Allacma fusca]
EVEEALDWGQ